MATATATELMIEGVGVTKVFKDFWGRPKVRAVTDVNMQVRRGQVFGLLGPNGAGKSTLMKMVLGHLYPTGGTLQVLGRSPRDVASKERLGYVPERAYLYKNLTAAETLQFFGEVLQLPADVVAKRSEQLLDMVGLARSRKRLVGEFSHGMMRRMGLAQALLNDPDLLLLDEPTAGLDPLGCRDVKNLILTLAERGKTIVLTSHLLGDVEDVCDELLIMYGGQVLARGPLHDLLAEKDTLQIRAPRPTEEVLRDVRRLLGGDEQAGQVEVSSPTRSLESFFLEVVSQASTSRETAGAQLGSGVAGYLREGVEASGDELQMRHHARHGDAVAEPAEPAPQGAAEEAPPPDLEALADLEREHPTKTAPESAEAPPAADEQALADLAGSRPAKPEADDEPAEDVDQDLLDDLTGKQ